MSVRTDSAGAITAAYGSWPSPLNAADVAAGAAAYADLVVDGDTAYWLRSDPDDGGRSAVVRCRLAGTPEVVSPHGFNARTLVHGYGGGALGVGGGVILACEFDDQRVYRLDGPDPEPVTPEPTSHRGIRWAAMQVVPGAEAFVAIRETHGLDRPRDNRNGHGDPEAVNELVRVDLRTGVIAVLVSGPDFVGGPWVSPSGHRVAWLQWDHPDMPFDAAELWVADLHTDGLGSRQRIAGGDSSVCTATWDGDDRLLFNDDVSGWWNVYAWDGERVTRLQDEEVDSGIPGWQLGRDHLTYRDGVVHVATLHEGTSHIRRLDEDGTGHPLGLPGVAFVSGLVAAGDRLVAVVGGTTMPTEVCVIDPDARTITALSDSGPNAAADIAVAPRAVSFPTPDGAVAHALYYAPSSATHVGPAGVAPPLLVRSHGGPTGAASSMLNGAIQYFTSRGIAVVDVNYRGSVGYGRAFRDALKGNWGIHDVTDCVAATTWLVEQGLADPDALLIEGGSAGGYTTLLALCTTDVFAAGASLFGVSDLRALARETHKFESRYLDSLVGRWPEDEATYIERSPITHVDGLRTPMIILQGDEDEMVPPAQAEVMVAALREKGVAHAYLLFAGEQHGFRKAENIVRSIEVRLAFYARILGFEPADDIDLPEFVAAIGGAR